MSLASMKSFAASLRAMPTTVAQRVAAKAAPVISRLAKESFDAQQDSYGGAWAPSADGNTPTLRKTGALEAFLRYVAIGTKLRVSLGVPYVKYQIGKRPVYPRPALLPAAYASELEQIVQSEARTSLEGGA